MSAENRLSRKLQWHGECNKSSFPPGTLSLVKWNSRHDAFQCGRSAEISTTFSRPMIGKQYLSWETYLGPSGCLDDGACPRRRPRELRGRRCATMRAHCRTVKSPAVRKDCPRAICHPVLLYFRRAHRDLALRECRAL